ncbi:penicillin-binding protein 2 [Acidipila rosea]|uniref:Peptidoglycan glycosyltransferase n=1 Tax=Acidipila rosea TaxID=768535 RepID=A0A4R1L4J5_9BACT|nr:penicillin-binding protein 2 [Acidipila rosea]MBW4028932.1 penicillin-binding protein 2 [Acidobacteriota bacterium]MBW4045199.1 penicillin-binding protein 2 [Acidobacteriota bacterium]TCK72037.1 peptidoglycan glycosyltransferase [Acidipila rosea]
MLNRDEKLPAIKLTIIQYVIVGILLILLFGLWRLQVVGASNYRAMAEANRIRKVPILAPRGKIFDREGRLIVDNYPSVSCFLVREQGHDYMADLPLIARGLHMTVEQIEAILKKYRTAPKYQPLPLKQDITPDEQEFIEAHRDEMPELETIDEQRRLYPRDGFAAHLVGYVGEVSEEMLDDPRYAYYAPGDVVGRSGVEESYDSILRGTDGSRDVLVDSHGREMGRLGTEHAIPGKSLKLTIDIDIQRAAENALGDRNGAVIAIDPHTGEVLAMVSRPTYDPNAFAVRIGREEWSKLITDPAHPLLNKAIQAQLAPGSTFKIIMALAGLQEGIAQTLNVDCRGGANFYGHYFRCWVHSGHGAVNITRGIFQSCDVYFYTLAERLGIEKIAKWAHMLGLGQKTGIDLPNEVAGTMPSEEWKMRNFHQKWYAGETISVGIGQGAVAATPVQMVRALAGIASGGALKRPHVVFPDELPPEYRKAILDSFPGSGDVTIPIDPANWETITDAMAKVMDPGGTDYSARLEGIDFAGKTGSAQTMSNALAQRMGHAKSMQDNAWFVGFSPRRNPDIAVCILFEGGEHGTLAGRLAARVIEAYVNKQRREHKNVEQPKTVARVDVGAIWSDPAHPQVYGGRAVVAHPKAGQDASLAAMHGGHFYLTIPPVEAAVR